MRSKLFVLFIAVLLLCPSYIAFAEDNTSEFIESEEAFWEWIGNHPYGGSITLGLDITVTRHIMLSGLLNIETGIYGVTLNGGTIFDLTITGEGVDTPVLTVIDPGLRFDSWDSYIPGYNITARGRNGRGGVAVHVLTDRDGSPAFIESQGLIRSVGKDAVGVLFDHPVKVHFLSVSVDGENSVAVKAPSGASLYYCKLEASGDGAKAVWGNGILLDTCKATADTSGAEVVDRKILALAGSWLYWPLAQGQDIQESYLHRTFCYTSMLSFLLSGDENHPAEVRRIYAQWDQDAIDDIDTSVIGKTVVPGTLNSVYQGLGLEDDFSLDLTVDIQDGSSPCIISLVFGEDIDTDRRYVYFLTSDISGLEFEPEDGNFILWRSDDEGGSWYDFTDSPDVSAAIGGVIFYYDEITEPIWFCIQEAGGEYSNIAVIFGYEGKTYGSTGGDRTGADRGGEYPETRPSSPDDVPATSSIPSSSDIPAYASVSAEDPLPYSEPIPSESAESAESARTKPEEWENSTTTAISGRRLYLMMDTGDIVTFIKNKVRLSIRTSALESLNIGDNQLFIVTVECLEPWQYKVSLTLDGKELYDLPCVVTMDGKNYDIPGSGIWDFAEESHITPAETLLPVPVLSDPSSQPADNEPELLTDTQKEKLSAWTIVGLALLGTGCATAGYAVFLKLRIKL